MLLILNVKLIALNTGGMILHRNNCKILKSCTVANLLKQLCS